MPKIAQGTSRFLSVQSREAADSGTMKSMQTLGPVRPTIGPDPDAPARHAGLEKWSSSFGRKPTRKQQSKPLMGGKQ
jgi:hypothetical protein